jgi:hypothetical protein
VLQSNNGITSVSTSAKNSRSWSQNFWHAMTHQASSPHSIPYARHPVLYYCRKSERASLVLPTRRDMMHRTFGSQRIFPPQLEDTGTAQHRACFCLVYTGLVLKMLRPGWHLPSRKLTPVVSVFMWPRIQAQRMKAKPPLLFSIDPSVFNASHFPCTKNKLYSFVEDHFRHKADSAFDWAISSAWS